MVNCHDIDRECWKGLPKTWGARKVIAVCPHHPGHADDAYLVTKTGKILCPNLRGFNLEIEPDGKIAIVKTTTRYFIREKKKRGGPPL
jgi:hypothetical protein